MVLRHRSGIATVVTLDRLKRANDSFSTGPDNLLRNSFVLLRGEYLFEQVLERHRLGVTKKKFRAVAIREFRMDVAILY